MTIEIPKVTMTPGYIPLTHDGVQQTALQQVADTRT